jgi:hypothetical protein
MLLHAGNDPLGQDCVARAREGGKRVRWRSYAGADHSFDVPTTGGAANVRARNDADARAMRFLLRRLRR